MVRPGNDTLSADTNSAVRLVPANARGVTSGRKRSTPATLNTKCPQATRRASTGASMPATIPVKHTPTAAP